ncbi:hypothetical protein MC885_021781 [Smutsia gigantea]|nr:hypothetical protein MC885_021781 [Smutsia gigantea]
MVIAESFIIRAGKVHPQVEAPSSQLIQPTPPLARLEQATLGGSCCKAWNIVAGRQEVCIPVTPSMLGGIWGHQRGAPGRRVQEQQVPCPEACITGNAAEHPVPGRPSAWLFGTLEIGSWHFHPDLWTLARQLLVFLSSSMCCSGS